MTDIRGRFYRTDSGELTERTYSGREELIAKHTPIGCSFIAGEHDHLCKRVDVATGEVVDWQPPKPEGDEWTDHAWDDETKRWLPFRTLAGHKVDAWGRVKRMRDEQFAARRMAGSVAYRISADRANLESLIAGRTAAGVPPEYAASWRDAENATHALDAAGLATLAAAMLTAGQAIYDRSWALQTQINACATEAEIAAIDLGAGWP